jgi:hypothetical protein
MRLTCHAAERPAQPELTHSGPRSKEGRGHTSRNGGITRREVIYAQEALRDLCVRVAVLKPEAEHNRSEERALDAFLAGLADLLSDG